MDKKYGVYICEGCGIGEALDIEKLCDIPKEEGLAVKTCPILCGKEGVALLKKDIADEGVNTLVIAACSRRVLYDVFRFDGCMVDRGQPAGASGVVPSPVQVSGPHGRTKR